MHKKGALTAGQILLNATEKLHYKNSDFNVCDASGRLFGRRNITVLPVVSTGLDYGLPRLVQSGCYQGFPDIVNSLSTELRTTGLSRPRKSILTILRSGI
jgi:hypothetical protein